MKLVLLLGGVLISVSPMIAAPVEPPTKVPAPVQNPVVIKIDPLAVRTIDKAAMLYGRAKAFRIESENTIFFPEKPPVESIQTFRFQQPNSIYMTQRGAPYNMDYWEDAERWVMLFGKEEYMSKPFPQDKIRKEAKFAIIGTSITLWIGLLMQGATWQDFLPIIDEQMTSLHIEDGGTLTNNERIQHRVLVQIEKEVEGKPHISQYTARFDENGALVSVESGVKMDGKNLFLTSDHITSHEIDPKFAPDTFEIKLPPDAKQFEAPK